MFPWLVFYPQSGGMPERGQNQGPRAEGLWRGGQGPTLTLSLTLSQAQASCTCRAHVEGPSCDRCKPGFWGLSPSNPKGCTRESAQRGFWGLGEIPGGQGGEDWPHRGQAPLPPPPLRLALLPQAAAATPGARWVESPSASW